MGRDIVDALKLSDAKPVELAREWGVRRLGEKLSIRTRGGHEKAVVADVFPAYDDDGGLLVALTPQRGPNGDAQRPLQVPFSRWSRPDHHGARWMLSARRAPLRRCAR